MSLLTIPSRRRVRSRALARTIVAGAFTTLATLGACSHATDATTGPSIPVQPTGNPQLRQAAFIADIDMHTGKIMITAPTGAKIDGPTLSMSGGASGGPQLSILAGDAITLIASNYRSSAVGAFTPGKVRVSFDVSILNKLQGYALITPTFPAPPSADVGPVLFPFETNVTTTAGGASVGGDGTVVIIDLPSYGQVSTSGDWNGDGTAASGAPHNFFNDASCASGENDCYRWEAFGAAIPVPGAPAGTTTKGIASLATSAPHVVGFDVDPTVGQFRARLIIAADLMAATPPVGDLTGNVTSPQRGNLSGVQVAVSGTSTPQASNGSGNYAFVGLPIGPKTVSIVASSLPAGCTAPASQSTSIVGASSVTVNFSVTCSVPVGTVTGTVTSSLGGALSNVTTTVTPTGIAAQPGVLTSGTGVYSRSGVPIGSAGTGSVSLSNLPANCTNPGAQAYSGLTDGGTITLNITVSCVAPPQGYAYNYTVVSTSGTQITIEARIDMNGYDDPAIPGADNIASFSADIQYNPAQLTFVSVTAVPGSALDAVTGNGGTAGTVSVLSQSTSGATGVAGVFRITFDRIGSGAAATTTSVLKEILTKDLYDLIPKILPTEASIPRP